MSKAAVNYIIQTVEKCVIYELIEKFEVGRTVVHYILYDISCHILGESHIVRKVGESYLGLYHPEFSRMALCI